MPDRELPTRPAASARRHRGRQVRRTIRLRAAPRAVWEAWALPDRIASWFVDQAEGVMAAGASVVWVFDHFGLRLTVDVYAADPPHHLAFGRDYGDQPGAPLPALQEVIVEQEGGTTVLRIVNSGFGEGPEADDEVAGVESGWGMALATLAHWLEQGSPAERSHLLVMRPSGFSPAAVQPWFARPERLRGWLDAGARSESVELAEGSRVELDLGGPWRGEATVLCRTARELLLGWSAPAATLGLKVFSQAGGFCLALDANAWPLAPASRPELEAKLEAAVDRLAALAPR